MGGQQQNKKAREIHNSKVLCSFQKIKESSSQVCFCPQNTNIFDSLGSLLLVLNIVLLILCYSFVCFSFFGFVLLCFWCFDQSWRRHLRALFEINLTGGRMANLAHVALNLCKMDTQQFPELSSVLGTKLFSHTESKVFLNIIPLFEWVDKVHGYAEPFWVLVENDMDHIVHYEYFLVKKQHIRTQRIMEFTVPTPTQDPLQYNIRIVSDRWREPSLLEYTCHFDYSKLPNEYPPQTRLLKSAPLPVTALIGPFYLYLYQGKIEHLNRVQTEVFEVLQKSTCWLLHQKGVGRPYVPS